MRVEPVPGEGLDSWLAALSRRLATPARDLLPALGLDITTLRGSTTGLTVVLRDDEATQVAKATGVPVPTLQKMTPAHYNAVLRTDLSTRRLVTYHAWTRRRGTWFCPLCLTETGGRWQLRWRLGWSFACVRHRCLLVDRCPDCGQIPRPGAGLLRPQAGDSWLHRRPIARSPAWDRRRRAMASERGRNASLSAVVHGRARQKQCSAPLRGSVTDRQSLATFDKCRKSEQAGCR
ncbi:TniQ family protein [Amycolatopsis sp. NPDC049868]|uniref:TniQ family protein n=1 Tax=Amycolatopsis sp. NPDC049868 TaxID=3363934 RepID=UPI00379D0933